MQFDQIFLIVAIVLFVVAAITPIIPNRSGWAVNIVALGLAFFALSTWH